MGARRRFVPEAPVGLEGRAVPTVVAARPLPHLSVGDYNQAVTDIEATFAGYTQTRNLILGTYGPTGPVNQGLLHAIRTIPYHHRSGLDDAMRQVVLNLQAALVAGSPTAISDAETAALNDLQQDVSQITFAHFITAS